MGSGVAAVAEAYEQHHHDGGYVGSGEYPECEFLHCLRGACALFATLVEEPLLLVVAQTVVA